MSLSNESRTFSMARISLPITTRGDRCINRYTEKHCEGRCSKFNFCLLAFNIIRRIWTVVVMCLITSGYSLGQALPSRARTAPDTVQSADTVRAALQPWLDAVSAMLRKTNNDDVRSYVQALRNSALMAPSGEGGPAALAQRLLAPPPDTTRPWVGVIVIGSHKDLPAGRWQQLASTNDFAAEYHDDTNTIYLRSDIPQVAVIRGLLLVHEMRHWWQARHPGAISESRLRKEVDAYETEFRVLDALNLPNYEKLLTAERLRIKRGPIQPDLNNPLLERVFGRFPSPVSRQIAAVEIALRGAFAELDTAPAERALQGKVELLRSFGSQ
jgi:hypothetical protein